MLPDLPPGLILNLCCPYNLNPLAWPVKNLTTKMVPLFGSNSNPPPPSLPVACTLVCFFSSCLAAANFLCKSTRIIIVQTLNLLNHTNHSTTLNDMFRTANKLLFHLFFLFCYNCTFVQLALLTTLLPKSWLFCNMMTALLILLS